MNTMSILTLLFPAIMAGFRMLLHAMLGMERGDAFYAKAGGPLTAAWVEFERELTTAANATVASTSTAPGTTVPVMTATDVVK